MSEQAGGAAPAAEQPAATEFIGGFAPAPIQSEPAVPAEAAAPTPEQPEVKAETPPAPEAPKEPATPLAEVLRARREAQEARQKAEAQAKADAERAARAEAEAAKLRGKDLLEDPVGFAKARNWTPEDQLLVAQSLLYDLRPDKATPEIRARLQDAARTREAKAAEARAKEATERAQREAGMAQANTYVAALDAAVKTFAPGSHPESEAWFDSDHENYMRSLVATAQNMAARASAEGRVADLTPAAVAVTLEADIAARMARRDGRRGAIPQPGKPAAAAAPVATSGKGPTGSPISTKGATGSGTPRPPAKTEAERLQRAMEVAFGGR